jgi:pimeloyl-ACP methyl ester carboxylesterase
VAGLTLSDFEATFEHPFYPGQTFDAIGPTPTRSRRFSVSSTSVSHIKGARMVILDCGHEIPLERPRELAALIEAFLAGLGERSG